MPGFFGEGRWSQKIEEVPKYKIVKYHEMFGCGDTIRILVDLFDVDMEEIRAEVVKTPRKSAELIKNTKERYDYWLLLEICRSVDVERYKFGVPAVENNIFFAYKNGVLDISLQKKK